MLVLLKIILTMTILSLDFGFKDEDELNKENIYNLIMYSCNKAKEIYDAIKEYF